MKFDPDASGGMGGTGVGVVPGLVLGRNLFGGRGGTRCVCTQRMADLSWTEYLAGWPALTTGPSDQVRAVANPMSDVRALMLTTITTMAAASAVTTILMWVLRSAVKSDEFIELAPISIVFDTEWAKQAFVCTLRVRRSQ